MTVVALHTGIVFHDATAETYQAGTSDHGSAVDPRALCDPGDSGGVPESEPSRLHHHPDHGLPARGQEGAPPGEEDQPCSHFRSADFAQRSAEPVDRGSARTVRRPVAAGYGASDRVQTA